MANLDTSTSYGWYNTPTVEWLTKIRYNVDSYIRQNPIQYLRVSVIELSDNRIGVVVNACDRLEVVIHSFPYFFVHRKGGDVYGT